jgi:hypothetical protein
MSLLLKKFHKIPVGSSLYLFQDTFPYPPFYNHQIINLKELLDTKFLNIQNHNIDEYREYDLAGGTMHHMTTIQFNHPGNYHFKILYDPAYKTNAEFSEIEVLCLDPKMEYVKKLCSEESGGHTCVVIKKEYPVEYEWCQCHPCKNKQN